MKKRRRSAAASGELLATTPATTGRWLPGVAVGVAVVVTLIVGLASVNTLQDRAQHRDMAAVATRNLALLLEHLIVEIIDKTDITLQSIRLDLDQLGLRHTLSSDEIDAHMARKQTLTPQIDRLRIADADGWVRFGVGVGEAATVNIGDRDYFLRLRDNADAGLVASEPVVSRFSNKPVIVLARRLNRRDGAFNGIIYATIDVKSLQAIFAEMDVGRRGAISLRTEKLDLVTRVPDIGEAGREISDELRERIASNPKSGDHLGSTSKDGVERTVAYRRVADYPFYLLAGLASDEYLAPWRDQARRVWQLAAIAILLTLASGALILRSRRRQYAATLAIARECQRNEILLRTGSDGMYVVAGDGAVIEVNDAFCALLGYERSELLAMNCAEWNAQGSETQQQRVLARLFVSGSGTYETRHRCRDGRVLNVEINAATAEFDGRKVLYASVRDITWRKQAEYALRDSERQLRRVLEGSDEGFWEWNLETNAISVSARYETMLGYAPGEMNLTVDNWANFVAPEDFARHKDNIERHLAGESPQFEMELPVRAKSGEWRWILTRGRIVSWASDDRPLIMAGTHIDISQRKHDEAALIEAMATAARANQAKSRFLAAASHDLRQPLAALALYLGALKTRVAPEDGELMKSVEECVDSLSTLLTDLLDVSKLDAGIVVARPVDFAVDELLTGLVTVHAGEARLKGLRLRHRRSPAIVYTDPILLRRLVGNLIANAIRYTNQGGVLVSCRRRGGKTWIEVWDSGIGIAEDQREFIFEEFSQLGDPARTHGSGLGLAIVARTAALLGLELQLRSRPGRGSCFAIEVRTGRASAAPLIEPPPRAATGPLRIALVDDHPDVLRALALVLKMAGHEVIAATRGNDLLARLGEQRPDIVIADFRLGGGENGLGVIAAVRSFFADDLPALLVTGDTDPALIRSMADRGIAVRYKPLRIDSLLAFINEALKR